MQIIVSFLTGVTASLGLMIAYLQLRQGEGEITLLHGVGSFKLDRKEHERGYMWRFHFTLFNRKGVEYAITDLRFRLTKRKINKKLETGSRHQWHHVSFPDGLLSLGKPLQMQPYEYKEINGYYYHDRFSDVQKLDDAEVETLNEIMNELMNQNVEVRLTYANGKTRKYKLQK